MQAADLANGRRLRTGFVDTRRYLPVSRDARTPAAAMMTRSMTAEAAASRRSSGWRRWVWIGALAFACGASFPYLSRMMNANERPRLLQAIAIVDHGTFAIDAVVSKSLAAGPDVSRAPGLGEAALVPNKPPGATVPAVLALGLVKLGGAPDLAGLTLWSRLLGAWLPTIVLAMFLVRRLGDDAYARAAASLVVLATPLAAYAHVLFGHSLAALCLCVGSTWMIDALEDDRAMLALRGGLVAALAVTVEYGAVVAAIPLGVALVLAWRRGVRRSIGAAIGGAIVPIAALAAYQAHVFGSPWSTGYHTVTDPGFAQIHDRGLLGLDWPAFADVVEDLVSPHGGLLYWAPIVVFAPLAWRLELPARERRFVRLQLGIFVAMLVLVLGLAQAGGWRVGPRYLVAALPMLAPALAVVLRASHAREGLVVVLGGVAIASTLVNALAANLFPHLVPGGNPLRDQLVPLLQLGLGPYTVVGSSAGAVWLPILAALAIVGVTLAQLVAPDRRARVCGAALVVAAGLLVPAWSVPPAEDAEQTLSTIVEIWEPGGQRSPRDVPL